MRPLSTAPPESAESGGGSWLSKRRDGLIHIMLSGIALSLSIRLTTQAHRIEDMEEEMNERLRAARRSRQTLLEQAPALALESGLPPAQRAKFEASLSKLVEQLDAASALPRSSIPEGSHTTVASATAGDNAGGAPAAPPKMMF